MKKPFSYSAAVILGASLIVGPDFYRMVQAAGDEYTMDSKPMVFQAAGPTLASIQSMVDAYRAALGANNGNVAGPLAAGRREINWDGGGSTATSPVPTPFDGFLVNRGARFTTEGTGFVQAPLDGLVSTFVNATYATIFQPFSPVRMFSAVGSNVTTGQFFVPGGGEVRAVTNAFGAVFTDVDQALGQKSIDESTGKPSQVPPARTSIAYYDAYGKLLYRGDVPASPGDASVSFFGIVFADARIAHVKITSGNVVPGQDDTSTQDVVMMDDFIYGEPQTLMY